MTIFETDIGVSLQFTLFDGGKVADLTSATFIKLLVNGLSGSPFTLTVKDAPVGLVEYITQAGDFPAGTYSANIEVAFATPTRVFTTKTFPFISKSLYGS